MLGFSITDPSNSLEWMIFLAKKYSSMFLEGTWLTLYIAVAGTILGFLLGYIIGIIQDIRINEGDSILKKGIFKILKAICRIYVEVFRDTPMIVGPVLWYPSGKCEYYTIVCRCYGNGTEHRSLHGRNCQSRYRFH